MTYVVVMIVSACGMFFIFLSRGLLRSRNVRRIARAVRMGFSAAEKRNAKWLPENSPPRDSRSPRTRAIELQQIRTFLRQTEKLLKKFDVKGAERALIQALTIQPSSREVKIELAKVYLMSAREPKAEALYLELLQECAEPALHANLGLACYKQEKYVEACKAYQQALNMDPKNPARSEDLGSACIAAKRFEEAAPLLEKALVSSPRNIPLLHLLSQCYLQINAPDKTEQIYRRINKLDPRDQKVKERLKLFSR